MSKFDELLAELSQTGSLDPEVADRIRAASDGSPLRKELEELRQAAQTTQAERDALRSKLTAQTFDAVGLKVRPDFLKLPDDLDTTDTEKVRAWATEAGLVDAAPSAPPEELAGHDRMAQAAAGATLPGNPNANFDEWVMTVDPARVSEDEFYAQVQKAGRLA